MSDGPNAPGAGGKRPPGVGPLAPGPLRPPTGSPLGYAGPIAPRPVPSVTTAIAATPAPPAAAEPTPSFVPKLRPPADPGDLVPESEGWEDDTIATGPEPTETPAPAPVAATPNPPRAVAHQVANARPSPARPVSPSSPHTPHPPPAGEGGVSEAALQKILDDVRFATRKEIPRLVDAEIAPVLRAQQEILARLDRLEGMIRASQASADEALQRANHAGAAAQAVGAQQASMFAAPPVAHAAPVIQAHAPIAIQAPAAPPVITVPSVPPPAYHGDPLGSMAPIRPMPTDVQAYTGGDIDIPNELTSGKGRGVKLMLLVAVLVLGGFAAMVISSNMH